MLRIFVSLLPRMFEPSIRATVLFRISSIALPLLHIVYFLYRTHDTFVAAALIIAVCMAQPPHRSHPTGSYRLWVLLLRVMIIVIAGTLSAFERPYNLEGMLHAGWSRWVATLLAASVFVVSDLVTEAHYRRTHGYTETIGQVISKGLQTFTMLFVLDISANVELYVRSSGSSLTGDLDVTLYTPNKLLVCQLAQFGDLASVDLPMSPGHYVLKITVNNEQSCRIVAHAFITPKTTPHTAKFSRQSLQTESLLFPQLSPQSKPKTSVLKKVLPISTNKTTTLRPKPQAAATEATTNTKQYPLESIRSVVKSDLNNGDDTPTYSGYS